MQGMLRVQMYYTIKGLEFEREVCKRSVHQLGTGGKDCWLTHDEDKN